MTGKMGQRVIAYYVPARATVVLDVLAARLCECTDCGPLVVCAAAVIGGVVCDRDTPAMTITLDI